MGHFVRLSRLAVGLLLAAILVSSVILNWRILDTCSYNPWSLKHKTMYAIRERHFFAYCFVSIGSSKPAIIRRLGEPSAEFSSGDSDWIDYVERSRRWEYLPPPCNPAGTVLVYEVRGDHYGIIAYYFLDEGGRLGTTYISEQAL